MSDPELDGLRRTLTDGALVVDPAVMDAYRGDVTGKAGHPLAVVRARSTEDVRHTVAWCARHGVPIVPRGAGTGLAGGASAVDHGLVLSLEHMNAIVVDPIAQTATVGAGALNGDVKDAALLHGLWYPPDPSSYRISTMGGNIATNAGGLCCVTYGVTRDYVLELEAVLADGSIVRVGCRSRKDVAGLSLLHLIVGSEGTLGVVTEATVRLVRAPGPATTIAASFSSVDSAARSVIEIRRQAAPVLLELLDDVAIAAVEAYRPLGLAPSTRCLVLVQIDQQSDAADTTQLLRSTGATEVLVTDDPDEGEMFIEARRLALPAAERLGALLLEDVAVPLPMLAEMCRQIDAVRRRTGLVIPVVAHAGDGNLHPMIVHDAADPVSVKSAHEAFVEIMRAAISLGGTITGEHGVGRTKRSMLPEQLGDRVMQLTADVKGVFDPAGILNPGVILDPSRKAD